MIRDLLYMYFCMVHIFNKLVCVSFIAKLIFRSGWHFNRRELALGAHPLALEKFVVSKFDNCSTH